MKKIIAVVGVLMGVSVLAGCSDASGWIQENISNATQMLSPDAKEEQGAYTAPEGATQVTGMVLGAYGNEITVQIATVEGMQEGAGVMRGEMVKEGVTQREQAMGDVPLDNSMIGGDRAQEVSEGIKPENTSGRGQIDGGNGGTNGAAQTVPNEEKSAIRGGRFGGENMSDGSGMPEGSTRPNMGSENASASVDYSDSITLSDETKLFVVPTGTVVEYYGFDMTFSQLAAEQYITITLSQDGDVLYVEVLG